MSTCLTGIKPTGDPHLGNYFGMIKPIVSYGDNPEYGEVLVFIANYHALNSHDPAKDLRDNTHSIALDLLASGLDPEKITLFYQSDIPELTELTWIFHNLVTVPYLERAHAYKDALAQGKEANMGLFAYPVLMAADILMYDSDIVPVGKDQKQHVEIAQKICRKFHHHYGEAFTYPEPDISTSTPLVPGLDGRKMSKSYNNTIQLFESQESTQKKIMKIATDSKEPHEPKNPDQCTLMTYYRLFASQDDILTVEKRYREGAIGYKEMKELLSATLNTSLEPLRQKRREVANDQEYVNMVLRKGAEKARAKAQEKLALIKDMVGLV